jgi:hypothetical protein
MAHKRLPPDDPREWLNRAKSNLARAQQPLADVYLEDPCFDAQQAAEKAIKAMFIHRGEIFLSFTTWTLYSPCWQVKVSRFQNTFAKLTN